jgi:hypothetical protein
VHEPRWGVQRIGDALALITDTAFDPGSIELARGFGLELAL